MKNFEDLVNEASVDITLAMMEHGGKGMKNRIHAWFSTILRMKEDGEI